VAPKLMAPPCRICDRFDSHSVYCPESPSYTPRKSEERSYLGRRFPKDDLVEPKRTARLSKGPRK
jgi:hypothetical protein